MAHALPTGERFKEIWSKRHPGGVIPSSVMTSSEKGDVNAKWDTMDGASCWMDAFHALWREVDPTGHAAMFRGTFYESAETMRADDDEEERSQ